MSSTGPGEDTSTGDAGGWSDSTMSESCCLASVPDSADDNGGMLEGKRGKPSESTSEMTGESEEISTGLVSGGRKLVRG